MYPPFPSSTFSHLPFLLVITILSSASMKVFSFIFLKYFIYFIFRQRGKEGERGGETHQCVVASHVPCTGDLALQPRHVPWLGIKLATLWFPGQRSVHWATLAREVFFLNSFTFFYPPPPPYPFPLWQVSVCSLYLWICFYFVNLFCLLDSTHKWNNVVLGLPLTGLFHVA